jgi:hypothetical protein
MARIPDTFNFGETANMTVEELVIKLQRMYTDLAEAVNSKPDLYQRTTDGQAGDTFLAQGSININLSTDKVEMLTNHVNPTTVTWTQLS